MSNVSIIQRNDILFMGCDSASSTLINGEFYRADELASKFNVIDGKVIFTSGSSALGDEIIKLFKNRQSRTIETLRDIAKALCCQYVQLLPPDICPVSMIVGTIENSCTVVYHFSQKTDFEIHKRVGQENITVLSGGIKEADSLELLKREINNDLEISEIYQKVFDEISFEGIGGVLTVLQLDSSGVRLYYQSLIKEKENLRRISPIHHTDINGALVADSLTAKKLKIVDSLGNTLIDASTGVLNVSNFSVNGVFSQTNIPNLAADKITSGTINADYINVTNINAGNLKQGSILDGDKVNIKNLSASNITSGTILASRIAGGILSGVTVDVTTNMRIGNKLTLNANSFAGIQWDGSAANMANISIDPASSNTMFVQNNAGKLVLSGIGGVYAGDQRLDRPPVAVFG